MQVSAVISDIQTLLDTEPVGDQGVVDDTFGAEQQKDDQLIQFLNTGQLPTDESRARKIALQAPLFAMIDGVLMFVDPKRKDQRRAVVPSQLQRQVMEENHRGHVGAHFSVSRSLLSLVVGRNVSRRTTLHKELSRMCDSYRWRSDRPTLFAPHPRPTTVPDRGS